MCIDTYINTCTHVQRHTHMHKTTGYSRYFGDGDVLLCNSACNSPQAHSPTFDDVAQHNANVSQRQSPTPTDGTDVGIYSANATQRSSPQLMSADGYNGYCHGQTSAEAFQVRYDLQRSASPTHVKDGRASWEQGGFVLDDKLRARMQADFAKYD